MKERNIIVLNLGSTSYKFKYYRLKDIGEEELLACGEFENIGSAASSYKMTVNDSVMEDTDTFHNHADAFTASIAYLCKAGILYSISELDGVGYKAVHAGELSGARIIDDNVLAVMEHYQVFAPAHNPVYIQMMKNIKKAYPGLLQIGYFETSYHTTIPEKRAIYGVPYEWKETMGIRKYGFHGSSHSYISMKMQMEVPQAKKIISVHLGGSSSLCAIEDGKSIAASMGATPQSGLFHNNRVGEFDVFCLPALLEYYGGSVNAVLKELSSNSGFLGLSGVSNDLRHILKASDEGSVRAKLAVDAFVDQICGYIGMYTAYLKGLDAIAFTGGIGLRSSIIRKLVCGELAYAGIELDMDANDAGRQGKISTDESRTAVYVWETNEELMVLRQCFLLLK